MKHVFAIIILLILLNGCMYSENQASYNSIRSLSDLGNSEAQFYVNIIHNSGAWIKYRIDAILEFFSTVANSNSSIADPKFAHLLSSQNSDEDQMPYEAHLDTENIDLAENRP